MKLWHYQYHRSSRHGDCWVIVACLAQLGPYSEVLAANLCEYPTHILLEEYFRRPNESKKLSLLVE